MTHIAMQQVLEFHQKMDQIIGDPRSPNVDVATQLRWDLIHEEFQELTQALFGKKSDGSEYSHQERIIAVADALGDLQYVILGSAITWGIDLAPVFDAIHDSNMSKSRDNKRSDGKILKGPGYVPPEIAKALEESKAEIERYGFGDDSFWPEPTVLEDQDPPAISNELKQVYVLTSIDRGASFFSERAEELPPIPDFGKNQLPGELAAQILEADFSEEPPTDPQINIGIRGSFTSYGAFVFDCPCGRSHGIQSKLGSRGGLAPDGSCECMCGRAFKIAFRKDQDPLVTVTTIEELRKGAA